MALKTKRNKRSLVTLKRTEVSHKQQEINDFTRLVIDGEIDLTSLLPPEDITEAELAKFPSIEAISAEMAVKLNHDIQHDTEVMDEILTKYDNHPLQLRLQMTLMRDLAKTLSAEEKDELYNFITDKNSVYLEPDDDLNDKIFDTLAIGEAGRSKKCIKNLQACIRRIEAKKTPHTFHDRPVYSFESAVHENLCFPEQKEDASSNYYQPPAAYAIAYLIYAENMMSEGSMAEALEALNESLSWNPVSASAWLDKANIFAELGDSVRTVEMLENAYPNIVTTNELTHFYLLHTMLLVSDDENIDNQKLAKHIIQLIKYLVGEDAASGLVSEIEKCVDSDIENITRDEFIQKLDAAGIPFGISDKAVKALEKTIATYMESDETKQLGDNLQKDLDNLKSRFNELAEI